jgi:hypothetical protein
MMIEVVGKEAVEAKSTKPESESEIQEEEEEDSMEKAVREQRESHQKRLDYLMNPFGPELEEQGVSEILSKKVCCCSHFCVLEAFYYTSPRSSCPCNLRQEYIFRPCFGCAHNGSLKSLCLVRPHVVARLSPILNYSRI